MSEINNVLFLLDPMNTGCVENQFKDEYEEEAEHIQHLIQQGYDIESAIITSFNYHFWDDCLSSKMVSMIASEIRALHV